MKKDIFYISVLRTLATLSVLVYHVGLKITFPIDRITIDILHIMFNWPEPVFIMITGMLYLQDGREIMLLKHIKSILRLIFVLVSTIFCFNFISLLLMHRPLKTACFNSLIMILKADTRFCYQFWYLYMAIGFYTLLPILNLYLHNSGKIGAFYLLSICFVFGIFIPTFNKNYDIHILNGAFDWASGYIFYLVLGLWLHKYGLTRFQRFILYVLFTVQLCLMLFLIIIIISRN